MIILPMAGRSSRFLKAGYTRPKFMLDAHGHSVFEHVLSGFHRRFGQEEFLFISLREDNVAEFVSAACDRLGLDRAAWHLATLPKPTEGQAQTIAEGLRNAGVADTPVTIFNIDTIRPDFDYPDSFELGDVDGYLEVFRAAGDGWSFVDPTPGGDHDVQRVTEKVRISELCSTGLYYFRSANLFLDAYAQIENRPAHELQGGERYVAPLYNLLIEGGCRVKYHEIPLSGIIPCGVPAEYEAFRELERSDQPTWLAGYR